MKNRRFLSMENEVLISMDDGGCVEMCPSAKTMKTARMPYRRATKCAIVFLMVVVIYAFITFLLHIGSSSSMPPFDPSPLSETQVLSDGSLVFRLAVITDLDKDSKTEDGKWKSDYRRGQLTISGDHTKVSVRWDQSDATLVSEVSSGGRAMELSDLVVFNKNLYTIDDRTGIIYKIDNLYSSSNTHVVPWVILSDGPGNVTKPMKGEWMTVKDGHLYVGGLGKEWTNAQGDYINDHPMWVKRIDPYGRVEHLPWAENYKMVRRSVGIEFPGYMVHEAVQWSDVHKSWFFLPRRMSPDTYDEETDEQKGTNLLIIVDDSFSSPRVVRVGTNNTQGYKGFSAFQFIPHTQDSIIVALKSTEVNGHPNGSYITVFNIDGTVILDDQPLTSLYKFEGLAII